MKKVGITGTIASGKTTVSSLIRRRGIPVFNCDNYAKMALLQHSSCYQALVDVLSKDVLDPNGEINPKKMAKMIFTDEKIRQKVNAIVHPFVLQGMRHFFENHQDSPLLFAEVPLLYEAGWQNEFDYICVVTCSKEVAVKRMMEDREYTEEEALQRYHTQEKYRQQMMNADMILENEGNIKELDSQINKWIGKLRREMRHAN